MLTAAYQICKAPTGTLFFPFRESTPLRSTPEKGLVSKKKEEKERKEKEERKRQTDKERMIKHLVVFVGLVVFLLSILVRAQEGAEPAFLLSPMLESEEALKEAAEQQQQEEAAEQMINSLLEQTNAAFDALFKDFPFDQVIDESVAPQQVT